MKGIKFSAHSREQMLDRGATETEVISAVRDGEEVPAKYGRRSFRKNFRFGSEWKGKFYETKQVVPIVVEQDDHIVIVTVFVFYFGG